MYIPDHFAVSDKAEIHAFIRAHGFGQLVSVVAGRLFSSHIPVILSDCETKLLCHLAKQNPQARELTEQEVMITLQGPHGYVSPSWYETPGVPTWNYQAVHIYGHCRLLTDADELATLLRKLTMRYESTIEEPWDGHYRAALLEAIVGIEIHISEIQCKYKLSQNRSREDQRRIFNQLTSSGSNALAQQMLRSSEIQGSY